MEKTCLSCKKEFLVSPQRSHQEYCNRPECQRARKRKWQRQKLAEDIAYRENQAAAQKDWGKRNKGYWKEYRRKNPDYTEGNRMKQRERNMRKQRTIVNMDASKLKTSLTSGRYQLVPISNGVIAKMDAVIVDITVIS